MLSEIEDRKTEMVRQHHELLEEKSDNRPEEIIKDIERRLTELEEWSKEVEIQLKQIGIEARLKQLRILNGF